MTIAQRLDIVGDAGATLIERAVAAFYSAGIEWRDERRVGRGDIDGLMCTFRDLGVPPELLTATRIAAKITREPIAIMSPLLWLAASSDPAPRVIECMVPPYVMLGDVPSFAFDKHTAAGKFAIQRLIRENAAIRDALAGYARAPSGQGRVRCGVLSRRGSGFAPPRLARISRTRTHGHRG